MKIKDFLAYAINKFRPNAQQENTEEKVTPEMTAELHNEEIKSKEIKNGEIQNEEIENQFEQSAEINADEIIKTITEAELDFEKDDDNHAGCNELIQKKCTCQSCGNIYYYTDEEISNVANIFVGKFYTSSQMDDFKQCPRCGSFATMYKDVSFWIDNKGNCVDVEESALIRPISPDTFQKSHHDFGHCTP